MRIYKANFIVFVFLLFLPISSCKKATKTIVKDIVEESSEKVGKTVAKNAFKNGDEAIEYLVKSNPYVEKSIKSLSKKSRKKLGEELASNPRFFEAFSSSDRMIDDFKYFTREAPDFADNINLLKFFSNAKKYGDASFVDNLVPKQSGKTLSFLQKNDGKVVGELKDGILELKDFTSNVSSCSMLKGEMMPNVMYKIIPNNGGKILIKTDDLGRLVSFDAKNVDPKVLSSELSGNVDLGPEFKQVISSLKNKKGKLDIACSFKNVDDAMNARYINIDASSNGKPVLKKSMENSRWNKNSANLVGKEVSSLGEKSMKELATSNKEFKTLYDNFSKNISKDFADGIFVSQEKGVTRIFSKQFPNSEIKISGNTITAKSGSLSNSGPVNEFLNYPMPNKTYKVDDDAFVYKTDGDGRVIEAWADRTKSSTISRNTQRNSAVQNAVIDRLDGRKGLDDSGHLFANTTGGPNELINQVPMNSQLNRNGQWRQLEMLEEQAIKDGKQVLSTRRLIYEGNSKRPSAIEFIYQIDGKETRTMIQNI